MSASPLSPPSHSVSNATVLVQPFLIKVPEKTPSSPPSSPNVVELSVHRPSKSVLKEFVRIFGPLQSISDSLSSLDPSSPSQSVDLYVLPTSQPSKVGSLLNYGSSTIADEKDRLLELFFSLGSFVSGSLRNAASGIPPSVVGVSHSLAPPSPLSGFSQVAAADCDLGQQRPPSSSADVRLRYPSFFDYVDPCSGLPVLSSHSTTTYDEVSSFQSLLSYHVLNAGGCRVLTHPVWGESFYPATMFFVGGEKELFELLDILKDNFKLDS